MRGATFRLSTGLGLQFKRRNVRGCIAVKDDRDDCEKSVFALSSEGCVYQVYSLYRVLEALLIEMAVVGTSLFRLVGGGMGTCSHYPQ